MSISTRFDQFVAYLRPPIKRIEDANRQVACLQKELEQRVTTGRRFQQESVYLAGSNAKHTALRSTQEHPFDVDLGVYFSERKGTQEEFKALQQYVREQLLKIYPEKPYEDFTITGSAVHIRFRTSRLHVDVVPIIRSSTLDIEKAGMIPRHDGPRLTSIPCHVDFVRRRTAESKRVSGPVRFNKLVRLVKWWNNQQEDMKQSSYFCELLTAAALEKNGVTDRWQSSLCRIFSFLCTHQLQKPILFDDYYEPGSICLPADHPVIVLDPVNPANNITHDWDRGKRKGYVRHVQRTYEIMLQACRDEACGDEEAAIVAWCRVFGNAFRQPF